VAIISVSGILLGLVVLAINRREAARKLSDQMLERQRDENVRKPKTWKEEVAEKLDQSNGSKKPATSTTAAVGNRRAGDGRGDETVEGAGGTPAVPGDCPVIDELTIDLLRTLEWKRFELLTVLYFNSTGVRAEGTCIGADGGVDAHLYRSGEATPFSYVQCKAWGSRPVDVKPVRELFGVMAANDIREGFFMATGDFSSESRAFVAGRSLVLVSGSEVVTRFNGLPTAVRQAILAEVTNGDYTTPTCPRCDIKLLLRDNAKDQSSFWGCRNYPRCHYTMKARAEVMDD
jgi:restriction system protein